MEDPANLGYPGYHTDYWNPLFELCEQVELPVCMHIGGAGAHFRPGHFGDAVPIVEISSAFTYAAKSSINLMVSPIPRKYPGIKLVWSEGGIGWITAAIERANCQWERHQYWTHLEDADILPSDVARGKLVLHDRRARWLEVQT